MTTAYGVNRLNKKTVLLLLLSIPAFAQTGATISVVIAPQGKQAVSLATGYSPKTATLARIDACNDGTEDRNLSTARLVAAVEIKQQSAIYSSEVVDAVLNALQQKDVFYRAQKAIRAGADTSLLLTALFKTFTPTTAALLQAAPQIASAILPAVGDPRDLAALSKRLMQDNAVYALSRAGSGNDCHTGLVVMVSGSPTIAAFTIQ